MSDSRFNATANASVLDYIQALARADFWGGLYLKFERGQVVHLREERALKPEELKPSGIPRLADDNRK
jgi:hypothetical protein